VDLETRRQQAHLKEIMVVLAVLVELGVVVVEAHLPLVEMDLLQTLVAMVATVLHLLFLVLQ
jgi:hypothetical protein